MKINHTPSLDYSDLSYKEVRKKRFSLLRGVLYALGITLVVVLFVLWLFNKVKG